MLFGEIRQPPSDYLAHPRSVFTSAATISLLGFVSRRALYQSNKIYALADSSLYHFGVLSSAMHMAWTRTVCGRLKSDYQYSSGIVYNNLPWPQAETAKQRQAIEEAAQAVWMPARNTELIPCRSLRPAGCPDLVKAHNKLDAAVDTAYSKKKFSGDSDRVAFLFELYQQISSPLLGRTTGRRRSAGLRRQPPPTRPSAPRPAPSPQPNPIWRRLRRRRFRSRPCR